MSEPLEAQLHRMLTERPGHTVGTAESCTGGTVAARITSVAGSSAYFLGGIVSYANEVKAHLLGVPEAVLANPGAVSEPCARAMAEGARKALGVDIAVATTGIAGPDGGTPEKPVGLVYIAVATKENIVVNNHHFKGERNHVRRMTMMKALEMLNDSLSRTFSYVA